MNSGQILDVIVRHAREVLPELMEHEFTPTDRLQELGANSVDRAEIITLVLESLALRIPRTELFGPSNIGDLAQLLQTKMNG